MAPWVRLAVAIGGAASPCCEFRGQLGDVRRQSVSDIWGGQEFRDFRAGLLEDKRDVRCRTCYETEQTGGLSLREGFNTHFAHHAAWARPSPGTDPLAPPPPVSLDIRFSNLCNFSCRMCNHGASTKWFADARRLGWTAGPDALIATFNSTEEGLAAIRPLLDGVEEIYWAGGEPLLLEQHYAILTALVEMGRTGVTLVYNTNLSELRLGSRDVLSLWSRFKNVSLEVSIDGTGPRGELIREGMSWQTFADNAAEVKRRCPHVKMAFGITVSVFNVSILPELYRDLLALGCTGPRDFHFHVLQEPVAYSIQILPPALKQKIACRLREFAIDAPDDGPDAVSGRVDNPIGRQFAHIADHMLAADRSSLIDRFRGATMLLDRLRRRSTADICPELAPLLRPPDGSMPRCLAEAIVLHGTRVKAAGPSA